MSEESVSMIKAQAEMELRRLEAEASAREVAGKSIGKHGLFYITLIVAIGVGASVILQEEKIAAVMGLLGASLTALISMLNGIAGASPKQDKPEFEIIRDLISKLERLDRSEQPMRVDVAGDKVTVTKGDHSVTAKKEAP